MAVQFCSTMFRLISSSVLIIALVLIGFCSGLNSTSPASSDNRKLMQDNFDWIAYLQVHPDLNTVFTSKEEATNHFNQQGKNEGRSEVRTLPSQPGLSYSLRKLSAYTKSMEKAGVHDLCLILYNLHPLDSKDDAEGSYELLLNNLQIFLYSINKDNSPTSSNFYWLNVINPEKNQYHAFVNSLQQSNTASVERGITPSNIFAHFRSLSLLRGIIKNKFRSVLLLSNYVRGPFAKIENGQWVKEYSKLLFLNHNGLVGSTMTCDSSQLSLPVIHSYALMLRNNHLLSQIVSEFEKYKKSKFFKVFTEEGYEAGISKIVVENKWNVSALLNYRRMGQIFYNGTCLPGESSISYPDTPLLNNPTQRCDLKSEEVIFFKWNGMHIVTHYEKYNCDTMIAQMSSLLQQWKQYNTSLVLHVHEGEHDGEVQPKSGNSQNLFAELTKALDFKSHSKHAISIEKLRDFFDWRAYLEFYPDLATVLSTKDEAFSHYVYNGKSENRLFPKIFPLQPGLSVANRKLQKFISQTSASGKSADRIFICYNLHLNENFDSYEVILNNLLIFRHAVLRDASTDSMNFYWINVLGENNIYEQHVRKVLHNQWNVAIVTRSQAPSDFFVFLRTFGLLKQTLKHKFQSIFCLNSGTRGPVTLVDNGGWLAPFRELFAHSRVGLVGPTVLCHSSQPSPFIPLYAFLLRANLISLLLAEFGSVKRANSAHVFTNNMYEIAVSTEIIKHGWKIASVLDWKRFGSDHYNGTCILPSYPTQSIYVERVNNPALWCNLQPQEVFFFHWNSNFFADNYVCPELKQRMNKMLLSIQSILRTDDASLSLFIPESFKGGETVHLYREYELEISSPVLLPPSPLLEPERKAAKQLLAKDKVCFLVRTSEMHDMEKLQESNPFKSPLDIFDETGIVDIILSLQRQTDVNWEAVFFITDNRPFDQRLRSILQQYNDSRMQYFDIPMTFRPQYSGVDAGYTPTDYVIREYIYNSNNRCKWFSTTNADNIYGSDIVRSVRDFDNRYLQTKQTMPEMILVAIDSRNFAELDYTTRKSKMNWDDSCKGLVSMLTLNELAYTVQPRPQVGKVDLAGAFLNTDRFIAENVLFSNFTDSQKYPCKGCQDGYMIEHLMMRAFWRYARLPLDGLRSIVFHGPSPTWCIASGMVWFDHPKVNRVRCIPQPIVVQIRKDDKSVGNLAINNAIVQKTYTIFDWEYFDTDGKKWCLRFTEEAFDRYTEVVSDLPSEHEKYLSLFL